MNGNSEEIIIYSTADGKANISLLAKDGSVWLNQNQLAELFATSKANISTHISNIFEDNELQENSVVKFYLTTAADGKDYNVAYYSLCSKVRRSAAVQKMNNGELSVMTSVPNNYWLEVIPENRY